MASEIYMPQLGLTMTEGRVVRWLKAPGDSVEQGEPVLTIETDKVVVEVEAPATGLLGPILTPEGTSVPIGGLLGHVLAPGECVEVPASGAAAEPATPAPAVPAPAKAPARVGSPRAHWAPIASPRARRRAFEFGIDLAEVEPSGPNGRIVEADVRWYADHLRKAPKASPLARRLAQEMGVDLQAVRPAVARGRIMEEDVRRAATTLPAAPAEPGDVEPLQGVRRRVAERMVHSFTTAPHFYLTAEVEATALVRMREGLLARVEAATGACLTITDILIRVCAQTLREFPQANVLWKETAQGGGVRRQADVNVGLAVSLDDGLVVPVIHRADELALAEIARLRADLVARARAGRLSLPDLEGGTFTLSNLGMYGVDQFQAIINPPQGAILAVGQIRDRPVAADGSVVVRPTMHLSVSVDHRLLGGTEGAQFLARIAQLVQEPYLLLS